MDLWGSELHPVSQASQSEFYTCSEIFFSVLHAHSLGTSRGGWRTHTKSPLAVQAPENGLSEGSTWKTSKEAARCCVWPEEECDSEVYDKEHLGVKLRLCLHGGHSFRWKRMSQAKQTKKYCLVREWALLLQSSFIPHLQFTHSHPRFTSSAISYILIMHSHSTGTRDKPINCGWQEPPHR